MHALRNAYASVLLDAGESIKVLSEYLGRSDPGFTLRTYTHLLPSSETRTRKAIDDAFAEAEAEHEDDRPGARSAHDEGGVRNPARIPRNPRSRPHKAIRLMPRLMQPMAEVLPLVQRLGAGGC